MVYTRYTNPTVQMFQDRLAALEGAEGCVATASGMAAILATAMVHLKSGDHVVCSNAVFGATIQLFNNILARFGVETTYVSPTQVDDWQQAMRAEHPAAVPRDAVQPAHRGLRHRRACRDREERAARCSPSTTCSARRRCSGRSSSAPTS